MDISIKEKIYVSIIIPIYNLEERVEKCINSIIAQTYNSMEIILIDDGSTDSSLEICLKYAKKDKRISVIHQDNHGVSSARNMGLKNASGSYVMFIDGDDYVVSDYVETYVAHAISKEADVVIGGVVKIESGIKTKIVPRIGIFSREEFLSAICKDGTRVYGYVCSKLYRLSLIKDNNIFFNEKMKSQEDLDFALSVYSKALRICCIDNCGYYYMYTPSNRKASAKLILGNQIKLYSIATDANADIKPMIPKFQSVLYTWLYHASSVQEVKEIIELGVPDTLLHEIAGQRKETKRIIHLFRLKKTNSIYRYFLVRGALRSILVKLHIAKPVE